MKERIERALSILIGLPLWDVGRAGDLEWFAFGERRTVVDRHGPREVGSYALHLQCAWRIVGISGIIVASRDRYYPAGDDPLQEPPGFEWDVQGANRCDERVAAWLASLRPIEPTVEAVEGDRFGGFRISLGGGFALEVFPDDSMEGEFWRLFQPYTELEHFVVTGRGIEE